MSAGSTPPPTKAELEDKIRQRRDEMNQQPCYRCDHSVHQPDPGCICCESAHTPGPDGLFDGKELGS